MRLCAVSKIYHSKPNSPYYFSIMPTLELTNKEVNLQDAKETAQARNPKAKIIGANPQP